MKNLIILFSLLFVGCHSNIDPITAVFSIDSLRICNLPVPQGYPQSQTHSGILYVRDSLCGYQYWLVSSPYPNLKSGEGDKYENPMLYFANSDSNQIPPVNFIAYKKNPIVERPFCYNNSSAYNSDPDLFFEDSCLYLLNRTYQVNFPIYQNAKSTYNKLAVCILSGIISNDTLLGFTSPKEVLISDVLLHSEYSGTPVFISPSLTFINGYYRLFYLTTNTYNDGKDTKQLVMMSGHDASGEFLYKKDIYLLRGKLEPWHMSVFKYKEKLYSIVCCTTNGIKKRCNQYLAEFDNGLNTFTIYQRPLIDIPSYRGSAFVREDGMFILYSSITYKLPSSKSVDGRDIVVAQMPFEKLLEEVKK